MAVKGSNLMVASYLDERANTSTTPGAHLVPFYDLKGILSLYIHLEKNSQSTEHK